MPSQTTDGAQAKRAGTEAKKSGARAAKAGGRATRKRATAQRNQVLAAAETAVDLPVGAVLEVGDRVSGLLELTAPERARRRLHSYRGRLEKSLRRTERRGAAARRDLAGTLKRNRDEVERLVRRALEEQADRAQGVVDRVGGRIAALR